MSYFTDPTDSLHHNGISNTIFKNGDTQTEVNEKLAAAIEKLTKESCVADSNTEITTINTDNLTNKSKFGVTDSFVSSPYQARLDTTAKTSGTNIFYDLAAGIKETDKLSYARIVVEGKNGVIVDTNKVSNSFIITPENFPATLSAELKVETTDGKVEFLNTKTQLSQTDTSAPVTLFKREFGGTELKTQTDVNNFLKERLDNIQNSVPNTISYGAEKISLQETVNRLLLEITELKLKTNS